MSGQLLAQTYSSQLLDAKTKRGIPYATVEYEKIKGLLQTKKGNLRSQLNPEPPY